MKYEKILTISVAAYNLEKLITKNLDSVINSKVRDKIEIIVTDDESKDNTAKIVEKYEEKYPEIVKLVKQKNMGPGSSINNGIKFATGKYFKMVDGDDWVETENLEKIINKLEEIDSDIFFTNYVVFNSKSQKIIDECKCNLPKDRLLAFNEYCKDIILVMHNIMFRTSILKENNIKIDNCFYTDVEYALLPMKYVKTFYYMDINLYVYLVAQDNQSVSVKSMQKNIKMHEFVLNRLLDFYRENKNSMEGNIEKSVIKRIALMAANQLSTYLTYDNKKERIERIKKFNNELKNNSNEIYKEYKKNKKAFFIINSNYILTNLISKCYMKKISKFRY